MREIKISVPDKCWEIRNSYGGKNIYCPIAEYGENGVIFCRFFIKELALGIPCQECINSEVKK